MGNRIIKESICTSEDLARLSMGAEILFYRLIVKADDYGSYYGNTEIIRSTCFPLKVEKIKARQIEEWLGELTGAGLIIRYEVDGRQYVQISKWENHQQIRAQKRKYPSPPAGFQQMKSDEINGNQVISDASLIQSNTIRIQSEFNPTRNDVARVLEAWNGLGLTEIKKIVPDTQRGQFLKKRIQEYGLDDVLKAIANIRESDFLMGNNSRGWKITFDWLVRPNNFIKVLEGNYTNSGGTNNPFLKVWEEEYGQTADH